MVNINSLWPVKFSIWPKVRSEMKIKNLNIWKNQHEREVSRFNRYSCMCSNRTTEHDISAVNCHASSWSACIFRQYQAREVDHRHESLPLQLQKGTQRQRWLSVRMRTRSFIRWSYRVRHHNSMSRWAHNSVILLVSPRYIHCSFVMFDTLSRYLTTLFSLKMHRPVKVLLCWTDRRMASKVRHLTSLSSALHQIMAETENVKLLVQLFCNSQNAEYSFILTTKSITQIVFNPCNNHQPYKLEASSPFAW